jgi:hypothetical protein
MNRHLYFARIPTFVLCLDTPRPLPAGKSFGFPKRRDGICILSFEEALRHLPEIFGVTVAVLGRELQRAIG